jgi:multiple sugar transport system substrate-binding protein
MGNEGEMVRGLIPEFERLHPGIRVVVQQIPWTAAHEKLLTAYAGESTPDVCQLGNTWIPEFGVLNALEPLEPWVERSTLVRTDDYFDGVLRTNVLDSTLFGIPWYVDTRVVFYRKDLLAEAGADSMPATWQGVLDLSERMKRRAERQGKPHFPFFLPTNEWVPAIILGMQAGGSLLADGSTRGNFGGPEFRRAFELLETFYRRGYSPPGQSLITNMYHSFDDGLIAMYITGPWNIGEFSRRLPKDRQGIWMTAPLPSMDSQAPGVSLPLGTSLVMFRGSRHKPEAWKLIEFLASTEQSINFYRMTGNLPPRRSAWTDTALANNVHVQAFYRQLQRVDPLPPVPEWEQIVIRLQSYVEFVATGALTVDAATRAFDAEVDQMLEKRRWLASEERRR